MAITLGANISSTESRRIFRGRRRRRWSHDHRRRMETIERRGQYWRDECRWHDRKYIEQSNAKRQSKWIAKLRFYWRRQENKKKEGSGFYIQRRIQFNERRRKIAMRRQFRWGAVRSSYYFRIGKLLVSAREKNFPCAD